MKKHVKFLDANKVIAFITVEITNRNKYPELSIVGEYAGSSGQCDSLINPATDLQKELLKFWDEKHLKKVSKKEQKRIEALCDELIVEFREARGDDQLSEMDETDALEIIDKHDNGFSEPNKILALAIHEDLTVNDLDVVTEEGGNRFSYGGREYLICDDEEADKAQDEDFDNYLDDCVLPELPENARRYFDTEQWKEDAKHDGRGHSLARYDGHEHEEIVGETYYYLYRQ